jgi:hypothetical protein
MEILSKDPLLVEMESINEESLYRVVDVKSAVVPNRQNVFYVPFSMRSKMSTQRYSIPGFPCLYLGTSVNLCCMESGKEPQRDYVCVSRYELQTDKCTLDHLHEAIQDPIFDNDEFKIFDVSIRPDMAIKRATNIDNGINDFIKKYVKWYPHRPNMTKIRPNTTIMLKIKRPTVYHGHTKSHTALPCGTIVACVEKKAGITWMCDSVL